jgi:hypothetical protein
MNKPMVRKVSIPIRLIFESDLRAYEKLIVILVSSQPNCHWSQSLIAQITGCSLSTVKDSLRRLKEMDVLDIDSVPGDTNIYKVKSICDWKIISPQAMKQVNRVDTNTDHAPHAD